MRWVYRGSPRASPFLEIFRCACKSDFEKLLCELILPPRRAVKFLVGVGC